MSEIGVAVVAVGMFAVMIGVGLIAQKSAPRVAALERQLREEQTRSAKLLEDSRRAWARADARDQEIERLLAPAPTAEELAKLWEVRVVTYRDGVRQPAESVGIDPDHWLYRQLAVREGYGSRAIFATEAKAREAGVNVLGLHFQGLMNGAEGSPLDPRVEIEIRRPEAEAVE